MAAAIFEQCGVGVGRVGLLFTHDAPMCAAILAALKCGKTYVPLDPGFSVSRLKLILEDCRPQAVLAGGDCLQLGRELSSEECALIEADSDRAGTIGDCCLAAPTDPAYILYTSGSTGKPKGVVQCHRNVLHFIRAYSNNLSLSPGDRMTLLSTYCFDAAVMAIFGALLNGACLCPRSVAEVGFAGIGAWIREYGITVYHSTPTVYRYFIGNSAPGERFEAVRRVVLGGEPVVPRDVALFKEHFARGSVMINGLGPTESTVTLEYFIDHDTLVEGHTVPVGRPVSETEILLLDEEGKACETEGELVVVSEHVALGYLNRPDLNAKVFGEIADRPGLRFYRSGDLVRYREDGNLEFLGRRDLQVKIHGVRIELGEIEAAAEGYPGVQFCLALAMPGQAGEPQLAAAIRTRQPDRFDLEGLLAELRDRLAPAMVPSHIVLLEEFPLTATGKVDRLTIAGIVKDRLATASAQAAFEPRSETEKRLCTIWKTILGHEPQSIDEDFFRVGGDSLGAVRLKDQIQTCFHRSLPLGRFFERRSFKAIAELLDTVDTAEKGEASLIRLRNHAAPGGAHLICICGIELYRPLAEFIGPPHSVSGVFLPVEEQLLQGQAMPELAEMAGMYGDAIREHQPHGPYYLAGVSFGGLLAYELARQLRGAGEDVRFVGIFDTTLPQTIGRARRFYAHAVMAAREGPAYIVDKVARIAMDRSRVAARLLAWKNAAKPQDGDEAKALANVRRQIYDSALERYRRDMPSYDGDVYFFRARERDLFEEIVYPLDCNWRRFIKGRCVVNEVPGGHISMLAQVNVQTLARIVRQALDQSSGTQS